MFLVPNMVIMIMVISINGRTSTNQCLSRIDKLLRQLLINLVYVAFFVIMVFSLMTKAVLPFFVHSLSHICVNSQSY
jgi:hypothetical protein